MSSHADEHKDEDEEFSGDTREEEEEEVSSVPQDSSPQEDSSVQENKSLMEFDFGYLQITNSLKISPDLNSD